ncbi:MAG: hypothetical protein IVW57_12660 [Ktedonobacterales bacterium]|nr:hypothetical protein [Ktedonobacterales bacterium]
MSDAQRRRQVSSLLEQRRRALLDHPDVSERMRRLSVSGSRHPLNPKRARRPALLTMLIASTAIAAMVLCGVITGTLVVNGLWLRNQLSSPSVTAQAFYGALHEQDFTTAYSYLSAAAKAQLSEAQFEANFRGFDQVGGVVESYLIVSSSTHGSTATVVVGVVRSGSNGQAVQQTLNFIQQSNSWRIDSAVPKLWS